MPCGRCPRDDVRYHIVDRHVGLELKEYRRIFRATDEAGQLDNISRRFAWFRRLLQTHEVEQGRVFPAEWKVGWHLLAKFSEVTRSVRVLTDDYRIRGYDGEEMGAPMLRISKHPPSLRHIAAKRCEPKGDFGYVGPHRNSKNRKAQPRPSLEAEESEEPTSTVLPSSTDLFYFYRQSLEQCAKLSTGQPLFDLCAVLKKWLKIYAGCVVSAAIVVQLKELEAVCDSSFGALVRTSWPSMNQVSGTSAYVGELINSVEQCLAIIKPRIEQKKYLRNLFDKTSR
ncbi:Vacuolar protein sorting-associated protein [Salix suchowensis]|nr:Vacuolar protein sorting-associated protein [Salix suchowensis]